VKKGPFPKGLQKDLSDYDFKLHVQKDLFLALECPPTSFKLATGLITPERVGRIVVVTQFWSLSIIIFEV